VHGACYSPAEYRQQADRQVYDIIEMRRDELAAGGLFTIDRPEDTLRDQLLAGDAELAPLDLLDCIRIAGENSREYQTEREALYLAALSLTLERWNFSVRKNGTFGAFLNGTGSEGDQAGLISNLGFAKLLGTGLSIVGDAGLDLVRDVSTGDGWDAVSNLSLNITQPLMRGFGHDIVEEPLTQAERDVVYQTRSYERFRRSFAFDVASRFFRILQQEDTLENEIQNYDNLIGLRERNEAFAEAGQLNDIEVDQARQNELSAENSVITARQLLETLLDDFMLFMGLPVDTPVDLEPGDFMDLATWDALLQVEFGVDVAIDVALAQRLDYKTDLDRVDDAARRTQVAADGLRAGLDFVAEGQAVSAEGKPLSYNGSDFDWNLSLAMDLPIDRLPERNAYRASLIALDESARRAQLAADTIVADLRAALRNLEAARESFDIQVGAVTLAERRRESTELNLEAGRANTRDVLESQEALVDAQNSAARDLTNYILSGISLYLDMELLRVTEAGIEVERAPLLERMGHS
jgi:outer membrane protein TolC